MHTHPAHSYVVGGWMAWTLSMLGCGLGTEHARVWMGYWARSGVDWVLSTLWCGLGTEHARVRMGYWARSGADWVLSTLGCGLKWLVRIEPLEAAAQREEQSSCVSGQGRGAQRGAGGCGQGGQGLCLPGGTSEEIAPADWCRRPWEGGRHVSTYIQQEEGAISPVILSLEEKWEVHLSYFIQFKVYLKSACNLVSLFPQYFSENRGKMFIISYFIAVEKCHITWVSLCCQFSSSVVSQFKG